MTWLHPHSNTNAVRCVSLSDPNAALTLSCSKQKKHYMPALFPRANRKRSTLSCRTARTGCRNIALPYDCKRFLSDVQFFVDILVYSGLTSSAITRLAPQV